MEVHFKFDCWPSHCWLLILPPPESSQQCWSSITSLLTINPLTVDCWSSIASLLTVDPLTVDCWSLIASLLTIDPLTVDCWSSIASLLTVNPLTVDCWSLIASLLTVNPLNCLTVELSIASLLTVDPLTVDLILPPWNQQSTVLIIDHLTVDRRCTFSRNYEISVPPRHPCEARVGHY